MAAETVLLLLAGQIAGYLIGGIPFAYLITRWKTGTDIRSIGSGNVGATNVGRLLGFRYFILVFLLDFLKGAGPVLLAHAFAGRSSIPGAQYLPEVVGFAAILGHIFPIYLGMKGGKGVATTIGVLLCLVTIPTLAGLVAWIAVALVSRIVSAASIAFALTFALVYLYLTPDPWNNDSLPRSIIVIALAVMIIVKHRSNIRRIIEGTEPRFQLRRSKASAEPSTLSSNDSTDSPTQQRTDDATPPPA